MTELYQSVELEEYPTDTYVKLNPHISTLKISVEGIHGQRKKKKVDLGKLKAKGFNSCRLSIVVPLEDISMDIRVIRELVSGLP